MTDFGGHRPLNTGSHAPGPQTSQDKPPSAQEGGPSSSRTTKSSKAAKSSKSTKSSWRRRPRLRDSVRKQMPKSVLALIERINLSPVMKWLRPVANALTNMLARGRFSSVTRRIVFFNIAGMAVLVGGVLYLNQFRQGLIEERKLSLLTQAEIIAGALAETATANLEAETIDPLANSVRARKWVNPDQVIDRDVPIIAEHAAPILRRLILPTRTRARLYDKDGWLVLDSRQLTASGRIISFELPPPNWEDNLTFVDRALQLLYQLMPGRDLPRYTEAGSQNGRIYDEVSGALNGELATQERTGRQKELIISVAVPVQRFKAVMGALLLSTEGDDIDAIVRAERLAIVEVFLIAMSVSILLSVLLAGTIAEPVRRLAAAAERAGQANRKGRVEIPDFTERRDEIGDLSGTLRNMTGALYDRIDAIESFAADVAHELKNPLTSMRSAIETLPLVKTQDQTDRLMEVIQHDIQRVDRLITDISEASRVDAELSREELEEIDLQVLLPALVDMYTAAGIAGGRTIAFEADLGARTSEPLIVKGVDTRLGQVLRNLLDNALSFSPPEGRVLLKATRRKATVRITVEDQGPGIPVDSVEKIFDRFHTDRPDSFGSNSGLGLSIARQIVEAHGGHLWAENISADPEVSDTPIGARFIVELPAP
ncbi:MAG: sensor histidine kinase [Parvibaculaceae bacterium]|nr:sensor histidine kinase [Parvibaculaceae bacterium]